jgi:hypothetical protein
MLNITVEALVRGQPIDNVTATFSGVTIALSKTEEANLTASVFSGSFSLGYYMPPADYSISIEAKAGKKSEEMSIEFEYLPLVAIEASSGSIDFGKVSIGKEYSSEIKVKNIGNTEVDIGLRGDSSISAALYYSIGSSQFSKLASSTVIKDINLAAGENSETTIKLKIAAPETIAAGKYEGKISIIAIGSQN